MMTWEELTKVLTEEEKEEIIREYEYALCEDEEDEPFELFYTYEFLPVPNEEVVFVRADEDKLMVGYVQYNFKSGDNGNWAHDSKVPIDEVELDSVSWHTQEWAGRSRQVDRVVLWQYV